MRTAAERKVERPIASRKSQPRQTQNGRLEAASALPSAAGEGVTVHRAEETREPRIRVSKKFRNIFGKTRFPIALTGFVS